MGAKSEFLSEAIVKLLNYRIEQEEFSSRLYLAMSTWATSKGYLGAGKLFEAYSKEELIHADKAKTMLLANGLLPITSALDKPQQEFKSLSHAIEVGFKHEKEITNQCYLLTKTAFDEGNFMVAELGLWYAREQVEEMDKFQNLLDQLDAFGDSNHALRELDEEMAYMVDPLE